MKNRIETSKAVRKPKAIHINVISEDGTTIDVLKWTPAKHRAVLKMCRAARMTLSEFVNQALSDFFSARGLMPKLTAGQLEAAYRARQRAKGTKLHTCSTSRWAKSTVDYIERKAEQLQISPSEVVLMALRKARSARLKVLAAKGVSL